MPEAEPRSPDRVVPPEAPVLAGCIGEAHRKYTSTINRRLGVRGYLFQGRFFSCVLDEEHLLAAAAYVLLNPVRAGMASSAESYLWSSAGYHLGLRTEDSLVQSRDLLGLAPEAESWRHILAAGLARDEEAELWERLRCSTRTGRPFGDSAFAERGGAKYRAFFASEAARAA